MKVYEHMTNKFDMASPNKIETKQNFRFFCAIKQEKKKTT
jgi:hypothetical protein